ncbi:MAG: ankyrin repeat domain-containing protein [Alphaproteobacteria bacterium]|nr:ankyrin repeat domain-containing protein [Alphaproteobacteria bacterium]
MKLFSFLLVFFLFSLSAAAETDGFTPLIKVVTNEKASPYAVESLIQKGGDVNATDDQGRSVLMLAAMHHPSVLIPFLLVSNGAYINAKTPDTGQTALFFAVQYNSNPEVAAALLNYGADQDVKDVFGKTAYDYADRNPKLKGSLVLGLFHEHHEEDTSEDSSDSAISR